MALSKYPPVPVSPEQAYWLAEAPYEKKPKKYLKKHCPSIIYEKSAKAGGFDFILARLRNTQTYLVSFRGTDSLANWGSNGRDFVSRQSALLEEMAGIVENWAMCAIGRGGHIALLEGHSRGGDFAANVKPLDTQSEEIAAVWRNAVRLTLNGHHIRKKRAGQRVINLRLPDDPLTGKLNHTKHCIRVGDKDPGQKGHKLKRFKDPCRENTWASLTRGKVMGVGEEFFQAPSDSGSESDSNSEDQ